MILAKAYAAKDKDSKLAPWNFERREIGPHDVHIRILYCGVCHSDIHQITDDWGDGIFPMVPGHEIVGRVINVGSHVNKFKVGELAGVGNMVDTCGKCGNCRKGDEQYCTHQVSFTYNGREQDGTPTYGGYSDNIVAKEEFVFHISEKLDTPAVAPLLCAGITVWSPMQHWKIGKGHKLAILGLGGLGHMAVKLGSSLGAEVTVLSSSASKEEDARKLGAHYFIVSKNPEEMAAAQGRFDFIIDTVSADHDLNPYLSLIKTNGTYIVLGLPSEPANIRLAQIVFARKCIAGSLIGSILETQEMLDYCAQYNIVADIEIINIKDIYTAFDRMIKGQVRYRFVIDMSTL